MSNLSNFENVLENPENQITIVQHFNETKKFSIKYLDDERVGCFDEHIYLYVYPMLHKTYFEISSSNNDEAKILGVWNFRNNIFVLNNEGSFHQISMFGKTLARKEMRHFRFQDFFCKSL